MSLKQNIDNVSIECIRNIQELDQAVNGLRTILDLIEKNPARHVEVFEKVYTRFCSFWQKAAKLLDSLTIREEIMSALNREEKESAEKLLSEFKLFPPMESKNITNSNVARFELRKASDRVYSLERLVYAIEKNFKDLHFRKTGIELLLCPTDDQPDYQEVLKLFKAT